jgi:hypothetical protein
VSGQGALEPALVLAGFTLRKGGGREIAPDCQQQVTNMENEQLSPSTVSRRSRLLLTVGLAALLPTSRSQAQTDYYNTDRGRPVQVEDAYVTERYAFELKVAPVRLARINGGAYNWGLEPEIAYGILPRTQIEIGLPVAAIDAPAQRRAGVAGLELSAMHNLNVETATLPAMGVRADVLLPVGSLAADRTYTTLTGMATRTFQWARVHLNGQYTFGEGGATNTGAADAGRWLGGLAVDKAFPLRSMLLTAELYARQPLNSAEDLEYTVGGGTRYQLTTKLALDGGVGRRLNGAEQGWYVTFGSAYAFGLRSLFGGMQ